MKADARDCQETVNERLKTFKILAGTFRHPLLSHFSIFWAVAVITQLNIENGQPLFDVEYYNDDGKR